MGIRELLILLLIFAIVVVVLRGLFVAIRGRKNRIKIALDKNIPEYDLEELELRELPSGGARQVERSLARVMQSQGLNESGSTPAADNAPVRKSTLKPPRTNAFKNRDQHRAMAASTVAATAVSAAATHQETQVSVADSEAVPSMSSEPMQAEAVQTEAVSTPASETVMNVKPVELEVEDIEAASDEAFEDEWMDEVSPAREINRTAAATTQSASSVLSERVAEQELEEQEPEEQVLDEQEQEVKEIADLDVEAEDSTEVGDEAEDFTDEGFDLDRAEPMFAGSEEDDDWESIEDDADDAEDGVDEAFTGDESDDEFDDEDWNPEAFVDSPDDEAEDDSASQVDDRSGAEARTGDRWQADSHDDDDALFSEAAADDLDGSDWDFDDEEERPAIDDWDDEEEDNNVFLSDVSEPGSVTEESEDVEREAAEIAAEESAEAEDSEQEEDSAQPERGLDNVLDELLEEEREAEEMIEDGNKTPDSLEYSANEDVDNEEFFDERDDEDFDPLFDYSENDVDSDFDEEPVADDAPESIESLETAGDVDSAVDQAEQLIAEEDALLAAEYNDREAQADISDTVDVTEMADEAAQYDDVEEMVETAETADADDADEDSVPDFDDELEADAEPEPSEDDAFAALDPEDDLDELFDDEDRLRRQTAMDEIEEKESSRSRSWMSWASGAFKRLGNKTANKTANQTAEAESEQAADTFDEVEPDNLPTHEHRYHQDQQPQVDQGAMQETASTLWQQDPVESDVEQAQWYAEAGNAQTGYDDEPYAEQQSQETVWNDADDQQDLGYPDDNIGSQQGAGRYQEQQLSLDIEIDAQAAEAAAAQQGDDFARQRRAAPGRSASQYQQQSVFDDGLGRTHADNGYDEESDDDNNEPSEVLAINVLARQGRRFAGDELLQVLLSSGLRFGEMSIFHRHANGKNGPVLFSVANALNPGTFDLNEISEFTTPGVCFFMTLPNVASNNMLVYEQMLATARHVQQSLDAELKDDNRSVMTAQTMEHYRQRIRDFELQQLKHAHGRR